MNGSLVNQAAVFHWHVNNDEDCSTVDEWKIKKEDTTVYGETDKSLTTPCFPYGEVHYFRPEPLDQK